MATGLPRHRHLRIVLRRSTISTLGNVALASPHEHIAMRNASVDTLGSFEQLLLFTVLQLGEGAYGVRIRESLEQTTGRTVSFGAIYTALARLEERGMVKSSVGIAVDGQRGRPPKYYKVSGDGARALLAAYSALQSAAAGLVPELTRLAEKKR